MPQKAFASSAAPQRPALTKKFTFVLGFWPQFLALGLVRLL